MVYCSLLNILGMKKTKQLYHFTADIVKLWFMDQIRHNGPMKYWYPFVQLGFHSVVVVMPALHAEGPGLKTQRNHMLNCASPGSLSVLQKLPV